MMERPVLSRELECDTFLQYYYLKEELIVFCRENGLCITGAKQDLTKRIGNFLSTGKKLIAATGTRKKIGIEVKYISLDSVIEENFVCTEKHREFFKSVIGNKFSFNVSFQKYLKNNSGKTYSAAVKQWYKIQEDKIVNKGRSQIDSQFEYNTYIRDFFENNKDKTLKDAINCWKYKKNLPGHNRYEVQDLYAIVEKCL